MTLSAELATAASDLLLCLGTFYLALIFKGSRGVHTWRSFFFALAIAAGFGALYHGFDKFHYQSFWVLVSVASMSASFLFFAACSVSGRPSWTWLGLLWPGYAVLGVIVGSILSNYPFWAITGTTVVLIFLSLYVLQGNPYKACRQNIFIGIGITILGFIFQKALPRDGIWNNNVIFHLMQLIGNYFVWRGAQKA